MTQRLTEEEIDLVCRNLERLESLAGMTQFRDGRIAVALDVIEQLRADVQCGMKRESE